VDEDSVLELIDEFLRLSVVCLGVEKFLAGLGQIVLVGGSDLIPGDINE